MESADERRPRSRARLTPQEVERERKRDSLLLQRKRVLNDIGNCRDDRYRKILSAGLAYLDSQLAALGSDS
jgi:hypothetical protein